MLFQKKMWLGTLFILFVALLYRQRSKPRYTNYRFSSIKTITAENLKKRMNDSDDLLLLNVLLSESYDDCHIKGSLSVPLDLLESMVLQKRWNRARPIVVYCANYHCTASREAVLRLEKIGFLQVMAYEGGIVEWYKKGYPVEGPCSAVFLHR